MNPQAANAKDFEFISGSRMRQMAKDGVNPPAGFMSQKGWEVLAAYYKNLWATIKYFWRFALRDKIVLGNWQKYQSEDDTDYLGYPS